MQFTICESQNETHPEQLPKSPITPNATHPMTDTRGAAPDLEIAQQFWSEQLQIRRLTLQDQTNLSDNAINKD